MDTGEEIQKSKPYISLVIPSRNEEKYLPRLLESVAAARAQYRGDADGIEVIVADNVSTDATAEIARAAGCRIATVETRRIGAVRNGGAALATGAVVAFVDADLVIDPETFNVIDDVMADDRYISGATGWKFERNSVGLALTRFIARTLVTAILRVEGGVVFCRRADFIAIGGYNGEKDIAEDVGFLRAILRLGKQRGQTMKLGTQTPAIVSTRKWDMHGDWHMFLMPLWPVMKKMSIRKMVDDYWYGDQR